MPKIGEKPELHGSAKGEITPWLESRSIWLAADGPNLGLATYVEISGRTLRFPMPAAEVVTFLERLCALLYAPGASAESVRALAFGPDNPILARHPTLPGAYPDASSVREPAYWVCVDLVLRAEAREAGVSVENAGRPFTTTMAEAARKLGRVQSSIVNAVENRTLHAWVHDGRHYLLPAEVAAYNVPRRGRPSKKQT
jgi:hypothetical protein